MNNRNPNKSVANSPVLVGAVTVLIAIVSVFLAYNANNGLPFVPTYQLTAQVPDAQDLFENNEVRIGGTRVGVVDKVTAVELTGQAAQHEGVKDDTLVAQLHMKLNKDVGPLPADSTIIVRPRSSLGLKYIQITPGHSSQTFPDHSTMPLTAATPAPVELDDFFNMFTAATRPAIQETTVEFGNALAGRGTQLNDAIGSLRSLVDDAPPVLKNLNAPQTRFGDFWTQLEQLSAVVAPVGTQQAQFFTGLDQTFAAFAAVARPYLQDTISKSAPTEDSFDADVPAIRPFFQHSAEFFDALRPGADALAANSTDIAAAFTAGVPALRVSPKLNDQLTPLAQALVNFQNTAGVNNGIDLLTSTNGVLDPLMQQITASQTTCDYLSLLFRNAASVGSTGDGRGNWTRVVAITPPTGKGNESGPSSEPANAPNDSVDSTFQFKQRNNTNHLHYNPYPNTAEPGQTPECEAGNEPYIVGSPVIGNVPGNQGTHTDQPVVKRCKKGTKLVKGKCVKTQKAKKK